MHPAFLDAMSWEMAEVYGAITDQILINLARHFPFYVAGEDLPKSAFAYQAKMLAQMGQVNAETMRIIRNGLADADPALQNCLEQSIIDAVNGADKDLAKAVKKGIFSPPAAPVLSPNQYKAFDLYYKQAADKLNLVNTVMLESTQSAYRQAVSDVVSEIEIADRINRTQIALDAAAGETVTGVSSWNQALRHATDKLNNGGIVGFIDHAGRRWSAEAYVAMDIRTTMFNTGRAAVWETNESFGNDLYIVSYHNGARPLCYPWQNKVISRLDAARTVVDLDGNEIEVIAQSDTSYGEPAGLFGINCKHYPSPFIPGVSLADGKPQDKEDNDRVYEQSQEQRRLERKLREEKRDYLTAKAQGRPQEELDALQQKCKATSGDIDEFCKKTGRARHRDREGVYTKREFPDAKKYDVTAFEREQKDMIDGWFNKGGAQQNFTAGQMTPNEIATRTQTAVKGIDPETLGKYPYKPSELPATAGALNVYGESIKFSEKMAGAEWQPSKNAITALATEFKTRVREVMPGQGTFGRQIAAGSVDSVTGTMMHLSSKSVSVAIHEFAHSISTMSATKYGFADDSEFWKEIRSIRTKYRKALLADRSNMISSYADAENKIDEFMAEAFTLGYMREHGMEIPSKYGSDTQFSSMVLAVIRKYFAK